MAYSVIYANGDGSTKTFPISFTLGFISRSDVTCRVGNEVDGAGNPVYRTLTWISDGLVTISGDPPPVGVNNVKFYRTVSKTQLIHDYQNGVAIEEENLDESNKQLLMALHEFMDGRGQPTQLEDKDMNSHKIVNLAPGTDPEDAVNYSQIAAVPAAVAAAQAAQAAAEAAQANAEDEHSAAAAEAAAAQASAEAAATAAASLTFPIPITAGGTGSTTPAGARTAFGLGTAATQDASAFDVAGSASAARAAAIASAVSTSVQKSGETGAVTLTSASSVTVPTPSAGDTSSKAASMANFAQGANGSSLVLISTATANNSASVDFTNIPTGYDRYIVEYTGVIPATNAVDFQMLMSSDNGATWNKTTNYSQFFGISNSSTLFAGAYAYVTSIGMLSGVFNGDSLGCNGTIRLSDLSSTTNGKSLHSTASYTRYSYGQAAMVTTGINSTLSAINAIRFLFASGNISSGKFSLYGVRRS